MRMYYHSYDRSSQRFRVGLATSPDGFRWQKEGRPIFEVWVGGWGGGPKGGAVRWGLAARAGAVVRWVAPAPAPVLALPSSPA